MSESENKTEEQLQMLLENYLKNKQALTQDTLLAVTAMTNDPLSISADVHQQEYRNIMEKEPRRIREDPVAYMLNIGLYYQGKGWRGYRSYIGSKILYPGFSDGIKKDILSSRKVHDVIDVLARKQSDLLNANRKPSKKFSLLSKEEQEKRIQRQYNALYHDLEMVAKTIVDKCIANMNSVRIFRGLVFLVHVGLARLYHQGVHIKESEWIELKRVALIAQEKKQSLILLPSHKSHVDYLVICYVMLRLGIQAPHIVAGNNLDMPFVGGLLKRCGAFFIRREWGDDVLYKTVLEEYIAVLLSRGMNIECFVEGTRSRLGKLLAPKLGILKLILDAFLNSRFSDCYIVPISLGYDKVIETSSYAHELLGNPKEKESIWNLLSSSRLLQLKWGRIDIRVAKPYSLREWFEKQMKRRGIMDLSNPQEKSVLLKSLGYRILADINAITVVMPSALVGTVILTLRGRGVGKSELIRRVDWLAKVITNKGGNVAEAHGMSTSQIVERALSIHSDLVGERKGKDILEPTFYGISSFQLSYYRNQVIHMFVEEAIACVSLYTIVKMGGGREHQRMHYNDLLSEVSFLSSLLKLDMIYKPGGIESNTKRTIEWLAANNVLNLTEDGWVELSEVERACGRENYDFLCFMIWPFIESYWLAAVSLFSLVPSHPTSPGESIWVENKLFASKAQALGKTLYYQGDLSYLEAVNKETMGQALTRYQEMGIILKRQSVNSKSTFEVGLSPDYLPDRVEGVIAPRGHLWEAIERIGRFRREGKNRRDNATVSTRVIRLADMLAQDNAISRQSKVSLKKDTQEISKL
ncbi:putative acyltransferase [Spinellus fusiger]|nr:putative acyltransferase [Spinellus fusiger]